MAKTVGTKRQDIEFVRGDTMKFIVEIKDISGTVSAVSFSCRVNATDSTYVFQKTLSSGIVSSGDGKYTVTVSPSDTASKAAGLYDYDLQFTISGNVYTPLIGKLRLLQDVTHT